MKRFNTYFRLLDKYFKKKKTKLVLELFLEDYYNRNLYFRIDYYTKDRIYKLNYIDLDHIESNNIEAWVNTCLMEPNNVFFLEDLFNNTDFRDSYIDCESHHVYINAYFKRVNHIEFYRFLPVELYPLVELFIIIFNNSPKKIEGFFFEMGALLTNNRNKYEYNDILKFDLFKGNFDKLFEDKIIQRGKKYFEDEQIKFLEKIDDKYIAVVEGADDYVVIIDYNEEKKEMKLFCSCPCNFYCKHIYAVLTAIRNNKFNNFYKLIYDDCNTPYLNRLMNHNYYISTGIEGSALKIINKDGNLETVPLFDVNHKINFKVIEDDDNLTMSKAIANLIDKS